MAFLKTHQARCRTDLCGAPVIHYIDEGWGVDRVEEVIPELGRAIANSGWEKTPALYFIAFCWRNNAKAVIDLWRFSENPLDGISGPLVDMAAFEDGNQTSKLGVASGNTLLVLGLEEIHRRAVPSLQEYLARRPELPIDLWK